MHTKLTVIVVAFTFLVSPLCTYSSPDDDYYFSNDDSATYSPEPVFDEGGYEQQAYNNGSYYSHRERRYQTAANDSGYYYNRNERKYHRYYSKKPDRKYYSRSAMPQQIAGHGERVIVVDPRVHRWGAYDSSGNLIRSGLASAGSNYCKDLGRPCRTKPGSFRIYSMGSSSCYSTRFPLPHGGAPMPYCMYFNGNQAIHGSNHTVEGNVSHGCIRVRVGDAYWIRFNFAGNGTKVIIKPY